jgi:hypothetical protein
VFKVILPKSTILYLYQNIGQNNFKFGRVLFGKITLKNALLGQNCRFEIIQGNRPTKLAINSGFANAFSSLTNVV